MIPPQRLEQVLAEKRMGPCSLGLPALPCSLPTGQRPCSCAPLCGSTVRQKQQLLLLLLTFILTLPNCLQDPGSGKVIGDSFDIATFLEDTFPEPGRCLFPPDSTRTGLDYQSPSKDLPFIAPLTLPQELKHPDFAEFNWNVDATFSAHVVLVAQYLPFNPSTAEATRALFAKRAHLSGWDDLCIQGDARQQLMAGFKSGLSSLAELFTVHTSGPYLEGSQATYADLIVGGWLNMMATTMPKAEWEEFRTWHGGVFARLHDALQQNYFECK